MKRVTIQDIAKKLDLSRNTVAKALNNSDTVSYDTRFLVIETAYEMGYSKLSPAVLNEFKVRNKIDETKSIVVLTRREISFFWNSIIMGISDELNKFGCKLQFNFINESDEKNLVLPLDLKEEVSGIIILSIFSGDYVEQIMKQNFPVVFLDGPVELGDVSQYGDIIICEGRNSIRTIASDLISRGLTKIGFIGDVSYSKTIAERYEGYLSALRTAGLPVDPSIVANYHTAHKFYKKEEVEAAIDKFPYMPEAIVCANDDIALFTIRYLNSKGLSVPADVAVTGYDNIEVIAQVEPMLTTVKVGNQRLGRRLVQKLMWRLQNPEFPKEVVYINAEVIFRKSSDKRK
ncbi:MAG TPA: LacI family transcriptional regulator [Lachnospiraceae bacterium]|nr:LacI family transcriptional regulator [Lachnospiraceae bacterium]HBY72236.1 LacI family transcriptional regulator [Lachnospiraceae bacterium]HCA69784.1 LacI family transcriptional regulator [Lachnospiraceae bacterium]HCM12166.1 LacI family transcriptional regulator [Lachnospiraceae bacterium]HCR39310.1 LacI family transcriptional regulator [Lachnospiraceae bacterium]